MWGVTGVGAGGGGGGHDEYGRLVLIVFRGERAGRDDCGRPVVVAFLWGENGEDERRGGELRFNGVELGGGTSVLPHGDPKAESKTLFIFHVYDLPWGASPALHGRMGRHGGASWRTAYQEACSERSDKLTGRALTASSSAHFLRNCTPVVHQVWVPAQYARSALTPPRALVGPVNTYTC